MKLEFQSNDFEQLKSPYYNDFFFQKIEIVNIDTEEVYFSSEFQGKFILLIWEALIELNDQPSTIKIKQFGKTNAYQLHRNGDELHIAFNDVETFVVSYQAFYQAFYNATKYYLNFIKRENPRISLEDAYQQLSASCYYFERHTDQLISHEL